MNLLLPDQYLGSFYIDLNISTVRLSWGRNDFLLGCLVHVSLLYTDNNISLKYRW